MRTLSPGETARAHHHGYTLLSRLYLEGVTAQLLPYLRALPALAADLPASPGLPEAAATHYHLFGLNLFPYESVYLDSEGLLGGQISAQVAAYYQAHGYPAGGDVAADHLGHQLGFLAHLSAAEADAWEDNQQPIARQLQRRQQTFLSRHLARWLPPFLVALGRQDDPFYRAVAALTWELVADHTLPEPVTWSLPTPPPLLADEQTGLRQITATLLSPPLSGFFLSREAIGALARHRDLPRGFGDREQLLLNLLRAAAQYDQFPLLLGALQAITAAWSEAYAGRARTAPQLAGPLSVWQQRVEETGTLLLRLAEKADAGMVEGE